jgi:hypothetical protein
MNQQAKDRLSCLLIRTHEDRRPKAKVEAKDKEEVPDTTTKSCLTNRKQEHLPGNCTKKRERFSTTIVEYQENKVRELLALELPTKKKKKKKMNEGDTSTVQCYNCNELGHYANKCPEPKQPRGIDLVICQSCNQKGHCARRCPEKNASTTALNGEDQRGSKFKKKTQPGAANWKHIFSATGCNRC